MVHVTRSAAYAGLQRAVLPQIERRIRIGHRHPGNGSIDLELPPESTMLSQSFSATAGQLLDVQFDDAMFRLPRDQVTSTPSTLAALPTARRPA